MGIFKITAVITSCLILSNCKFNTQEKATGTVAEVVVSDSVKEINKSRLIQEDKERKQTFDKLTKLLNNKQPKSILDDSVFFFLIPIDASCPFCRDKSTKAVIAHLNKLKANQFIIFSANGLKPIKAYFRDQNVPMPKDEGHNIFYDSDNQAFMDDLIFMHPTAFYCYHGEAYEKVVSFPLDIDKHLNRFFKEQ